LAGELRFRNVSATDNNLSAISFYNSNNAVDSRIAGIHKSHSSRYGEIAFLTHNGSALVERMRIDSSGRVGIGAATPSSILHLNGSNPIITFTNSSGTSGNQGFRIAFDNDRLTFQRASDGGGFEANYLAINQDTGKIGVMITDPSEYLELSRTAGKIGWGMNGNYGTRIGYFDDGGGTHGFHIDTKHVGTTTSESRFIVRADSGNVGIGTKGPTSKLDVIGSTTNGSGVVDTLRLRNTGTTVNDGPRIQFTAGTSTSGAAIAAQGKSLNSADLLFYAGGNTERMRIASDGKVTMPNQPHAQAYLSGNQNISAANWTQVNLNATDSNIGSHYNTSNYRFTAPVAGKYLITYSINFTSASGTGGYLYSRIDVNGAVRKYTHGMRIQSESIDSDTQLGGSLTVYLAANDYVTLAGYSTSANAFHGSLNPHRTYCNFTLLG